MIWEHLAGELSVRPEQLQAATAMPLSWRNCGARRRRARRHSSTKELARVPAVADRLCWDSLSRGDIAAFARQAPVCADLRLFAACARLIDDD